MFAEFNQTVLYKHYLTDGIVLSVNRLTCLINDIIETLDSKQKCAALFVDLSKAFDTFDLLVLLNLFQ